MEHNTNEKTVNIADLLIVLKKCWILMLIVGVVACCCTVTYAFLTYQEEYTAEYSLVVIRNDSSNPGYTSGDYSIDLYMVNDITILLQSPGFLEGVANNLSQNENFTQKQTVSNKSLASAMKVDTYEDSRVITFSVNAKTKEDARIIADTICNEVQKDVQENFGVDRIGVMPGYVSEGPTNAKLSIIDLAIPVVLALGVFIIFLVLYISDDKISSPEDVEKHLGLSVLGMIPNVDDAGKVKGRYYSHYKYSGYHKDLAEGKESASK